MQLFLTIMIFMLLSVNIYQQKRINLLEDRTLLSLKLLCKKMRKDNMERKNECK